MTIIITIPIIIHRLWQCPYNPLLLAAPKLQSHNCSIPNSILPGENAQTVAIRLKIPFKLSSQNQQGLVTVKAIVITITLPLTQDQSHHPSISSCPPSSMRSPHLIRTNLPDRPTHLQFVQICQFLLLNPNFPFHPRFPCERHHRYHQHHHHHCVTC